MGVAIVADSSCDFPAGEGGAVELVPIFVHVGGRTYRDGVELSTREFYRKLALPGDPPSTSPPPVEAFDEVFQKHTAAGREVLCVTVSSKISQVFERAQSAAARFAGRVRVFDSRAAGAGVGLLVQAAVRASERGMNAESIASTLERLHETQHAYAIFPDLRFLERSGRINKAQLVLGLMLRTFPIARLNADGVAETEATATSWEKAQDLVAGIVSRRLADPASVRVRVMHTNALANAEVVADALRKRLTVPLKDLQIGLSGPAIAANVGPGAVGIFTIQE